MDIQPHDSFFKQIFSNPKRVKLLLDIFAKDVAKKYKLYKLSKYRKVFFKISKVYA